MRCSPLLLSIFAALCGLSFVAGAAAASPLATDQGPAIDTERTESYRLPLLAADVAAAGLLVAGYATETEALFYAGGGLVQFGGPAVHLFHGNIAGGVKSVVLRSALPSLGLVVGYLATRDDGGALGPGVGLGVGLAGALAIDYLWLAEKDVAAKKDGAALTAGRFRAAPTIATTSNSLSLGLSGTF